MKHIQRIVMNSIGSGNQTFIQIFNSLPLGVNQLRDTLKTLEQNESIKKDHGVYTIQIPWGQTDESASTWINVHGREAYRWEMYKREKRNNGSRLRVAGPYRAA